MSSRRREPSGFTLIELMIVVVVMGLVLGLTAPAVSRFVRSSRLAGARSTLVNDLRYARSLAASGRTTYELRLAPERYTIVRLAPVDTVLVRALPRGVTIANRDTASFYAWGLTETMAITLRDGGSSKVIRTTASGQVTCD
ncbi:MAG: prepilin-type N-terminal cleavage/methylation domain-containing protein [Candidatus Eisenbacteria bacterium]